MLIQSKTWRRVFQVCLIPINLFLRMHEIEFAETNNHELQLVYRGMPKTVSKTPDQYECRIWNRLKEDFAIHGFQFSYDIHNNTTFYFNYYRAPELIQDLQHYLNINLIEDYRTVTSRYCALCKVPFSAIADIDENDYYAIIFIKTINATPHRRPACLKITLHGN